MCRLKPSIFLARMECFLFVSEPPAEHVLVSALNRLIPALEEGFQDLVSVLEPGWTLG